MFLLGGLVRVTGSGMGCPDWPKCFGLLAPPTCPCQLPANYQEIFLKKRIAKVERFTSTLERLGFAEKAKTIRADRKIYEPEEFNVAKAWIEYINRIFGVLAGLFALGFTILSFRYRKQKGVFSFALLGLFMLILNAWIGSIVVATNLLPGLVSIHFMLSFLCIFFIMLSMHRLDPFKVSTINQDDRKWWQVLFIIVILEVLIGTWARERVELLESTGVLKLDNGMLDYIAMGSVFAFHRFLPGAIFIFTGWLYFKKRTDSTSNAKSFMMFAAIVLLQICFGAFNIVFALPPWSQIIHIVLGSFMPIYAFYFLLVQNKLASIQGSIN